MQVSLKKDQLLALVRALDVGKATGLNKPALQALLVERFGTIDASQFAEIEVAVSRGVALTLLPPPPEPTPVTEVDSQLALPDPTVLLTALASAPVVPVQAPMPLALSRPRRHPPKDL